MASHGPGCAIDLDFAERWGCLTAKEKAAAKVLSEKKRKAEAAEAEAEARQANKMYFASLKAQEAKAMEEKPSDVAVLHGAGSMPGSMAHANWMNRTIKLLADVSSGRKQGLSDVLPYPEWWAKPNDAEAYGVTSDSQDSQAAEAASPASSHQLTDLRESNLPQTMEPDTQLWPDYGSESQSDWQPEAQQDGQGVSQVKWPTDSQVE